MNLTGHIARKDWRRLTWPVAGWLAWTAGAAAWFATRALPEEVARGGDLAPWVDGIGALAGVASGLQLVTGALLGAMLVLEDVVVGTTSHWQTRPVSGARLLAAKSLTALLLLVLAPTAVMLPVWVWGGLAPREVAWAAGEFAGWQAGVTLVAMSTAALVKDLGQFVPAVVGVAVALGLSASGQPGHWLGLDAQPRSGGATLLAVMTAVPLAAVLVQQYLTRRAARGWVLISGALVAIMVLRTTWADDFSSTRREALSAPCELALREGAEVRTSSGGLRVVSVRRPDFGVAFAVVVEERGYGERDWRRLGGVRRNVEARGEVFTLVNRQLGAEWPLRREGLGAAGMSSMLLGVQRWESDASLPTGWEEGAVLRRVARGRAAKGTEDETINQP